MIVVDAGRRGGAECPVRTPGVTGIDQIRTVHHLQIQPLRNHGRFEAGIAPAVQRFQRAAALKCIRFQVLQNGRKGQAAQAFAVMKGLRPDALDAVGQNDSPQIPKVREGFVSDLRHAFRNIDRQH